MKTRLVLWTYLVTSSSAVFIVPHSTSINKPSHCWRLHNNCSPKWRWLVVVIYRATKQRGKYPPPATDTEVNNCFSIYQNSEIIEHKNDDF